MSVVGASERGGRLTIPDAQPQYSGQYICTVYFVNGDRRSAYATLVVEVVRPRGLFVVVARFLPKRDYVTFGSLLSQFRLSSVRLSSVTFVHPTQGLKLSAIFLHRCVP